MSGASHRSTTRSRRRPQALPSGETAPENAPEGTSQLAEKFRGERRHAGDRKSMDGSTVRRLGLAGPCPAGGSVVRMWSM